MFRDLLRKTNQPHVVILAGDMCQNRSTVVERREHRRLFCHWFLSHKKRETIVCSVFRSSLFFCTNVHFSHSKCQFYTWDLPSYIAYNWASYIAVSCTWCSCIQDWIFPLDIGHVLVGTRRFTCFDSCSKSMKQLWVFCDKLSNPTFLPTLPNALNEKFESVTPNDIHHHWPAFSNALHLWHLT